MWQKYFAPLQKETKHINASAADLLHTVLEQEISIVANADIAKTKRKKQVVFVVERWMQCLLLRLNSQSAREASRHPALMGYFPIISRTRVSLIYLVDEFFFLFLVQLNETKRLGESKISCFCFQCSSSGMRKRVESKISFCHSRDLRASTQTYRKRGGVLQRV